MKYFIKTVVFILVGFIFLCVFEKILSHKWVYPRYIESAKNTFDEFYHMDAPDSIQAFFLGASNIEDSVDPMKIYQDCGVATFNLGTAAQSIQGSYYLLQELFNYYHPKYVFYDVSSLFVNSSNINMDSIIIDNLRLGRSKIEYVIYNPVMDKTPGINTIINYLFSFFHYHSRWDSLGELDFKLLGENPHVNSYRKGYLNLIHIQKGWTDASLMNTMALKEYTDVNGNIIIPDVREWNYNYLLKMIELCKENKTALVLVKIPKIGSVDVGWTDIKSDIVKNIAVTNNIEYLDLLYDYDLSIDWEKDSYDGGEHMNYNGSRKVTAFFEEYLQNHFVPAIENKDYESDLAIYDSICRVSDLVSSNSLFEFLQSLTQIDNTTIIISASDEMTNSLSEETIRRLEAIGIRTDLSKINYQDSFISIINNGYVEYEEFSERKLYYESVIGSNKNLIVVSSGFMTGSQSQIKINWIDYSMNNRGLNIVVFDNKSGLVLDSVSFDTYSSDNPLAIRDYALEDKLYYEYQNWLMTN